MGVVKAVHTSAIGQAITQIIAAATCGVCVVGLTAIHTGINGGSLGDMVMAAAITAASMAAFHQIGTTFGENVGFPSGKHLAKVVAHGVVGGVSSKLQGGRFNHGFLSAGFTQFAAPGISKAFPGSRNLPSRVVAAAVVGGTASVIGGGKFANGAVTGAFSRLYNDEGFDLEFFGIGSREFEYLTIDENGQLTSTSSRDIQRQNFDIEKLKSARRKAALKAYEAYIDSSPLGMVQVIIPSTTATISKHPIGGDARSQIRYGNFVGIVRKQAVSTAIVIGRFPVDPIVQFAIIEPASKQVGR